MDGRPPHAGVRSILSASILPKLSQVFFTEQTVLITASSGTGLWEAAARNCVNKKVLTCVNGAFAERFSDVAELNGKEIEVLSAPWGQPILPERSSNGWRRASSTP
jgi:aspartate aminotransferase-like enzyme